MTDEELMQIALEEARQALAAGEFPVGCAVAGSDGLLVRTARRASAGDRPSELEHAEIRALRRLERLTPPPRPPLTLATTLEPCLMCFGAILLAGVTRLVYAYEDVMGGASGLALESVAPLYRQRRPTIVGRVGRPAALALFQAFFADPDRAYWRDSALARYTLDPSTAAADR